MTQATPIIGSGQSGLDYRQQDNDGKQALLNHHKASTAPSYKEAGVLWLDDSSTPWILKIYDGTDWIVLGEVNSSTNTFNPYQGTAALRWANHAGETGAANAYAIAPVPALTAYVTGQVFVVKITNNNTTTSTLAVSGLAAKTIKLPNGANVYAGALLSGGVYIFLYDGTNMLLLNPTAVTSFLNPATDSGAADAYAVAPVPAITAYVTGQVVVMKAANTNTTASTLNVSAVGNKSIKLPNGADPYAGAIIAGAVYSFMYDGTNMLLLNPTVPTLYLNFALDTGSANAYAVAPVPPISGYVAGQKILLKPAHNQTSSCTIDVCGLGTKNIKNSSGSNPASGSMVTTGIYELTYDGTNFVLQNPEMVSSATKAILVYDFSSSTILYSYNVSGVVKNATGDLTMTFTTPIGVTTYGVSGAGNADGTYLEVVTATSTTLNVISKRSNVGGNLDNTRFTVIVSYI